MHGGNLSAEQWRAQAGADYESQPQKALEALQHALALEPSHMESWYQTGSLLYSLGQFTPAIDAFQHAASLAATQNADEWQKAAQDNIAQIQSQLTLVLEEPHHNNEPETTTENKALLEASAKASAEKDSARTTNASPVPHKSGTLTHHTLDDCCLGVRPCRRSPDRAVQYFNHRHR